MMVERLKQFGEINKVLPNRILVYRKRVSEVRLPFKLTIPSVVAS
jgi:hypothetical protein